MTDIQDAQKRLADLDSLIREDPENEQLGSEQSSLRMLLNGRYGAIVAMGSTFESAAVGDYVTRMLCGRIPQELMVTELTDDRIICGPYEFGRTTGHEIDEDISVLVSYLSKITKKP